jgi:hypothetical protein
MDKAAATADRYDISKDVLFGQGERIDVNAVASARKRRGGTARSARSTTPWCGWR